MGLLTKMNSHGHGRHSGEQLVTGEFSRVSMHFSNLPDFVSMTIAAFAFSQR